MPHDAGNIALFFDLAGTLVAMDETRQLPIDAKGNITIKLMPGVREKLDPIRDHLMFVVTNQAGVKRGRFRLGASRGGDGGARSAVGRHPDRMAGLPA